MLEQLGTVFGQVISWMGQFVAAIATESGALQPLLPLLFVGCGVSLILVGVKIVRKIMWGN